MPPAQSAADVSGRVALLGPLQLTCGGREQVLGGAKLRAIVAQLALAEGRIVAVEQLIGGVWGDDPPATVKNTLQYHVAVLRRLLTDAGIGQVLRTRAPGYALDLPSDLTDFAEQRNLANREVAADRPAEAAKCFARALANWRGSALADLRQFPFAEPRGVALDAQRLSCLEAWMDAELQCDRAEAIIGQLQDLVTEHPTRERLWEQLMVALYRTGRQAAALSAFDSARDVLDVELGVQPSQRLKAVRQAVLTQDKVLLHKAKTRTDAWMSLQTRLSTGEPDRSASLVGPVGIRVALSDRTVVIGRQSSCDLVLADAEASRRHAEVLTVAAGHAVLDMSSTNGTFVNGTRIAGPTDLNHGDRIQIGNTVLRYEAGTGG